LGIRSYACGTSGALVPLSVRRPRGPLLRDVELPGKMSEKAIEAANGLVCQLCRNKAPEMAQALAEGTMKALRHMSRDKGAREWVKSVGAAR